MDGLLATVQQNIGKHSKRHSSDISFRHSLKRRRIIDQGTNSVGNSGIHSSDTVVIELDNQPESNFPVKPTVDSILTFLMQRGFIRRLPNQCYTIAIPGSGTFVKNLLKGRKQILNLIRKR